MKIQFLGFLPLIFTVLAHFSEGMRQAGNSTSKQFGTMLGLLILMAGILWGLSAL